MGVVAFWLFAQTTLNIAPDMSRDLGMDASMMNVAVAITSLFSGIFIVVMGGLADRVGRVKVTRIGFYLSIAGSLLVAHHAARVSWHHRSCCWAVRCKACRPLASCRPVWRW